MRSHFLGIVTLLLLGSCSKATALGARFIDGRLAFVPLDGEVGCIHDITICEGSAGTIMWEVPYLTNVRTCTGGAPIFYGHLPGRKGYSATPLSAGVDYEISGSAEGGNYLSGRFRIIRVHGVQLRDLPLGSLTETMDKSIDIANHYR